MSVASILTPYWTPIKEAHNEGLTGVRALYWYCLTNELCRNYIVPSGRRAVKSILFKRHAARTIILPKLWHGKAPRIFIAGPTEGQIKRIAYESTLRLIPPAFIKRAYSSRGEMRIVTHFGGELWFVGLDRPERIEGDEDGWDWGLIDETPDISPDAIQAHIEPAMATRDGALVLSGVPDFEGPNSPEYKECWDRSIVWNCAEDAKNDNGRELKAALREVVAERERIAEEMKLCSADEVAAELHKIRVTWAGFSWKSSDIMQEEQIQYYRERMTPYLFMQEFEANWITAPGRAYDSYNEEIHKLPTPYIPGLRVAVSCDFNYGHHNWIIAQVDYPEDFGGLPYFRIFEQVYLPDSDVLKMCYELVNKLTKHDKNFIIEKIAPTRDRPYFVWRTKPFDFHGDYSGDNKTANSPLSMWKKIKRSFPDAKYKYTRQGSISTRLDDTNAVFMSAMGVSRIQIDARAENLLYDCQYNTRKQLFSDNKTGEHTHAGDCLGYLIVQTGKKTMLTNEQREAIRRKLLG